MKLAYTILYVKDVSQSMAFYTKAFGLKQRFIHDKEYAEMETETTTLAFASTKLAKANLPQGFQENNLSQLSTGIEIGFVVEDVLSAFKLAVDAGAHTVVEPRVKPWGQTVAYVRDFDGILVSINSPM